MQPAGVKQMSDHDISVLNGLIQTTLDSVKGFREAADDVDNSQYGATFAGFATDRSAVATLLQDQVRTLGGTPEDDTSFLASAHRGFMNLKEALTGNDDKAVVNEVERGEDHIKAKFEKALQDDKLLPATRSVIEQGYTSVRSGHDKARALKHSLV
jgi:uncharacterized protein (TIGR02284 family)